MGAACSTEPSEKTQALVPYAEESQLAINHAVDAGAVQDATQGNLSAECCSFEQLVRPLTVLREGLVSLPPARVPPGLEGRDHERALLVGPIIGRVTDTTASFLVEVAEEIDININVVQVYGYMDQHTHELTLMGTQKEWLHQPPLVSLELKRTWFSQGMAVCTAQRVRPGSPVTFQLQKLEPETPYMVFISNVPEAELLTPLRFRTMPARVESLRLVVIGDYAASNKSTAPLDDENNSDPWQHLHHMVSRGAEVQVGLHVGRTFAAQMYEQIRGSLVEHQSFCEGPKQAMLREARARLREAYRTTLGGNEHFRKLLCEICSNISVFIPPLDLQTLLNKTDDLQAKPEFSASLQLGDIQELLCLSLEVYREYQRAMWDGSWHYGLDVRQLGRGWHQEPVPDADVENEEVDASTLEFLVEAGKASSDSVEEWHIHRYGLISILVLDTKGNAMTAALTSTQPSSVLSQRQWAAVDEVLADEAVQVLLLVADSPLALEEDSSRRTSSSNPMILSWRDSRQEQSSLLQKLFQWKLSQYPCREVIVINGGAGFSTTGDLRDSRLGLSIPVIFAGVVEGQTSCHGWQLTGEVPGGRFKYSYRQPSPDKWGLHFLDIDLGTSQRPAVDISLVTGPLPQPHAPRAAQRGVVHEKNEPAQQAENE
ncbi:Clec16a [Symbiodinium microadriaticum]|nr:Clec16a [Symbiodinium microadriaticum]